MHWLILFILRSSRDSTLRDPLRLKKFLRCWRVAPCWVAVYNGIDGLVSGLAKHESEREYSK